MQYQPRPHTVERGTTVHPKTKAYAAQLAAWGIIFFVARDGAVSTALVITGVLTLDFHCRQLLSP